MSRRTETHLVSACLDTLRKLGIFAWRNNSGAAMLPGRGGAMMPVRFGLKGSSDILGIIDGGRFLAVECKQPKKYPTKEQRAFLAAVKDHGGCALVVRSVDDLIDGLRNEIRKGLPR